MTASEIDEAIMSCVSSRWQKVAMVIGVAGKSVATPGRDDEFDLVATRIRVLVREGRLVAQGDVRRWRESEIRLP